MVETIPFSPWDISNFLVKAIQYEQGWLHFFTQHGIEYEALAYEDFVADYEATLARLLTKFGVAEKDQVIPAPPLKKVSNQVNENFRSQFLNYVTGSAF